MKDMILVRPKHNNQVKKEAALRAAPIIQSVMCAKVDST
jgi:hypothetical protein